MIQEQKSITTVLTSYPLRKDIMDINKLLQRLEEADDAYTNGKPIMTDLAYDLLKDKVLKFLPPDHPRIAKVGHAPSSAWPKETHSIFMGSQNKVCTVDAIREWVAKTLKALGVKKTRFILQYKLDGFSLGVDYLNGKLSKAITRGDGTIGENITPNAMMFRRLPTYLAVGKGVSVRGEGLISKENYAKIQAATGDHYKNPRNAASGISRRLDGSHSKYVEVVTYDINAKVQNESDKVKVLEQLGFSVVETFVFEDVQEIVDKYIEVKDKLRPTLPYDIDGLVLKVDSVEQQEKLGIKDNRPEGQVALKFDSDQAITVVLSIALQVGRTGKITPVAILEPVDLMGSTVTKATLHNFAYIEENQIGIGSEVVIEKKGDIIPQVVDVATPGEEYKKPTKCPSCGGPLEDDGTNMWCFNPGCRERETNRIAYWIKVLDMKGFSGKFILKMWDEGKVRSVGDLYKLTTDDFVGIDGLGDKKVKAFFEILKSTSEMYLDKFIVALGIPSVSSGTAEDLVKHFKTWDAILSVTPEDMMKIPGYADTSARAVCSGVRDVRDMAEELLKAIRIKEKKAGALTGKTICITGALTTVGRKEAEKMIMDQGGSFKNSVSRDLDYLVTNDPNSGSGKNAEAKKVNDLAIKAGNPPPIKVISEKDFMALVGTTVEAKAEEKKEKEKKDSGVTLVYNNIFEED